MSSVAVVVIAWQQWQVASNKLRLDLFDQIVSDDFLGTSV